MTFLSFDNHNARAYVTDKNKVRKFGSAEVRWLLDLLELFLLLHTIVEE